jgi:hypothetical protein
MLTVAARTEAPTKPCWHVATAQLRIRHMLSSGGDAPVKWYYRPIWVLVLLFVVLGPLGLPYLWKSPRFSRGMKIVLTILVIAYMGFFVDATIHLVRVANQEMETLGTLPF